jgi:hypothetical protein
MKPVRAKLKKNKTGPTAAPLIALVRLLARQAAREGAEDAPEADDSPPAAAPVREAR